MQQSSDYSRSNVLHRNLFQATVTSLMSFVLLQARIWTAFSLKVIRKEKTKGNGKLGDHRERLACFDIFCSKALGFWLIFCDIQSNVEINKDIS